MQIPGVVNTVRDPGHGNVFRIYAYRTLTRQEMLASVANFYAHKKNKKYRKKGKTERVFKLLTSFA